MFRLLIAAALAYAGYRAGRKFVRDVPSDFEPLPIEDDRRKKRSAR